MHFYHLVIGVTSACPSRMNLKHGTDFNSCNETSVGYVLQLLSVLRSWTTQILKLSRYGKLLSYGACITTEYLTTTISMLNALPHIYAMILQHTCRCSVDTHWILTRCALHKLFTDARERMHDGALSPCPFIRGAMGADMPFYKSITRNFMAYQDRIQANLLQLFVHPGTSEWFSTISGIIFEVNMIAEQKLA